MSDDLVKQSIAELQDIVRCRCHPAYTGRGMHDPDCECDSADAVKVVADRIEELEEHLKAAREDANEAETYAAEMEDKLKEMAEMDDKLAKAVDVIDWALICWDDHNKHGYVMQGDWVPAARTTLAELKGEKTDE